MNRANVNGMEQELPEDVRSLAHWLREDLELTGTKTPCGSGHCGGCTVLVDAHPVLSCCTPAIVHDTSTITTVEGLAEQDDPLLRNFVEHGAVQCGFCTAGMIVAARAYLTSLRGEPANEGGIRRALAGNVCRCSGYTAIVTAIAATAGEAFHA
jgi:aerobic-type carbon monoxide dehydrogenase small subunit (CoxS/CutS family)